MKSFATVFGIAALILALVPVDGIGQIVSERNAFSLQAHLSSTAHDKDCQFVDSSTVVTLTLYLYDPVNPTFGLLQEERPVANVAGFECNLEFSEGAEILNWVLPANSVNHGSLASPRVYYGAPLPVASSPVALASIDVLFDGSDVSFDLPDPGTLPCYLLGNVSAYIRPAADSQLPGFVNYLDADDSQSPLVGGQSFMDYPDFSFAMQQTSVSADQHPWASLKALFR